MNIFPLRFFSDSTIGGRPRCLRDACRAPSKEAERPSPSAGPLWIRIGCSVALSFACFFSRARLPAPSSPLNKTFRLRDGADVVYCLVSGSHVEWLLEALGSKVPLFLNRPPARGTLGADDSAPPPPPPPFPLPLVTVVDRLSSDLDLPALEFWDLPVGGSSSALLSQ